MAYMTVSHRRESIEPLRVPAQHRSFQFVELWSKIIFPFRVIGLLFMMVAHPDRYSLDDDK